MQVKFNREHILKIFAATHRLAAVFDPEVDPYIEVTDNLLFSDWVQAMDLIRDWHTQHAHFQKVYEAEIPADDYRKLYFDSQTTLGDLAQLIANNTKTIYVPPAVLGHKKCETGGTMKFLLRRMRHKSKSRKIINARDSLNYFLNADDMGPLEEINAYFPGALPEPKEVSHARLLPIHKRLFYLRRTKHWIFPGISNLRSLFEHMMRDVKTIPMASIMVQPK